MTMDHLLELSAVFLFGMLVGMGVLLAMNPDDLLDDVEEHDGKD